MTKMFDFVLKGANASQLEKDIGSDMFPANEHYFGLVNVSQLINSFYCRQIISSNVKVNYASLIISYFNLIVRKHMLLEFCTSSIILL